MTNITVQSVNHLKFLKARNGVKYYEYKVTLSNGKVLEGDDYITVQKNYEAVKRAMIEMLNDMFST